MQDIIHFLILVLHWHKQQSVKEETGESRHMSQTRGWSQRYVAIDLDKTSQAHSDWPYMMRIMKHSCPIWRKEASGRFFTSSNPSQWTTPEKWQSGCRRNYSYSYPTKSHTITRHDRTKAETSTKDTHVQTLKIWIEWRRKQYLQNHLRKRIINNLWFGEGIQTLGFKPPIDF